MKRNSTRGAILCALLVSGIAGTSPAQAPAFDVASIKVMEAAIPFMQFTMQPGGRLVARNVTTRLLIRTAYGLEDFQVVGGSGWLATTRYEVNAVAGRDVSREEALAMLRSLLAERFTLRAHTETRQLPIYELAAAQSGGRLGSGIRRSGAECAGVTFPPGVPPPPPPPPAALAALPRGGTFELGVGAPLMCPSMFAPGWISGRRVTMSQFVARLSPLAGRPVVDRTGLPDTFDIDLSYANDLASAPAPGAPAPPGGGGDLPGLATAIREQLGLRLDPARGPVDVLVIDGVERPTEN